MAGYISPLSYTGVAAQNPPTVVRNTRRPTTRDFLNFALGTIWIIPTSTVVGAPTDEAWILVNITANSGTWIQMDDASSSAQQFDTDSGSAVPAANILNILGSHGLNTTGSGNTVTVLIDNAITLGDLTPIAGGSDALTLTTGDITLTTGSINLPTTTATAGVVFVNDTRFMHAYTNGLTANSNTFLGNTAGNFTSTSDFNVGIGSAALASLTTGDGNDCIGSSAGQAITTGDGNVSLGSLSLSFLTTGSYNTAIGDSAGINYAAAESNNIVIGNSGTLADSGVIRVGTNATHTSCFVAGIDGVNVGNVAKVVTMASDKLGTATITAGSGITVTPTANTITIARTGGGGGSFSSVVSRVYTSNDTYTPTTGMEYCIVECVGGGGGGGGTASGTDNNAPGGGAGGYCRAVLDAATVGASQIVTIGAGGAGAANASASGTTGGNTTFGAILTANGGTGGGLLSAGNRDAGVGGTASGGDINITGMQGGNYTNSKLPSGIGGSTIYGAGGGNSFTNNTGGEAGKNGSGYGSGGSGALSGSAAGDLAGGDGASGIVIITEYVS